MAEVEVQSVPEYKFLGLLNQYTIVSSSVNIVTSLYGKSKDMSKLTNNGLTKIENGIKLAIEKSQPVVRLLEPKLHVVDDYASQKLTTVEDKVKSLSTEYKTKFTEMKSAILKKPIDIYDNSMKKFEELSNNKVAVFCAGYARSTLESLDSLLNSRLDESSRSPPSSDPAGVLTLVGNVTRKAYLYTSQVVQKPLASVVTYSKGVTDKVLAMELVKTGQSKVQSLYDEVLHGNKVPEDAYAAERIFVEVARPIVSFMTAKLFVKKDPEITSQ